VIRPQPITLEGYGLRLEPMTPAHRDDLGAAAADGRLWELWFTSVPEPSQAATYIEKPALNDSGTFSFGTIR